jgi:hypothetical protein
VRYVSSARYWADGEPWVRVLSRRLFTNISYHSGVGGKVEVGTRLDHPFGQRVSFLR